MYFCYSYCLAVYLDWFPTYLNNYRHFSLKQMDSTPACRCWPAPPATCWAAGFRHLSKPRQFELAGRRSNIRILLARVSCPERFTTNPSKRVVYLPGVFRIGVE